MPKTQIGHNSVDKARLKKIVTKVETLTQKAREAREDVNDALTIAKAEGFCPKTIKKIIKMREMEPEQRAEEHRTLMLYANALDVSLSFTVELSDETAETDNEASDWDDPPAAA
jgi:uncharacterized protein (UPF0335 family)